jgi:hypothetical protein
MDPDPDPERDALRRDAEIRDNSVARNAAGFQESDEAGAVNVGTVHGIPIASVRDQ